MLVYQRVPAKVGTQYQHTKDMTLRKKKEKNRMALEQVEILDKKSSNGC